MNTTDLQKCDLKEFILNYDYANFLNILSRANNESSYKQLEKEFILALITEFIRAEKIKTKYYLHCIEIGKDCYSTQSKLEFRYKDLSKKSYYLYKKLDELGLDATAEIKKLKSNIEELQKPVKKTAKATIEGKPLNLSERFQIINQSLGLWEIIDNKNISQLKKYKLLALILGINEDNARKLILNNYDSKDRPELIKKYLEQLK